MSTDHPTIALVHGAFAESSSWSGVIERLHRNASSDVTGPDGELRVVAIANPLRSLQGDATYVRDVLASIPGPVIVVAHSYGGMVVTEAAAGNDAVRALVYVGAFAPEHGESAFGLSTMFPGSSLGEALEVHELSTGGLDLVIRRERFRQQFAADVAPGPAALMGATQRPVTQAALTDELTTARPAWRHLPSWFVYGARDLNIPAALSRFMAERAGARGVRELAGASHALSVSEPDAVAATILGALAATALTASSAG